MKRFYPVMAVLVLTVALVFLTACAPKPEEINAVVDNFIEQWKAGNAANMTYLMTSEVEFGVLIPEDAVKPGPASFKLDTKDVDAQTIAELMIAEFNAEFTFKISDTRIIGTYAIVTVLLTDPEWPDDPVTCVFHLIEVEKTWKISLIGMKAVLN